MKALCATLLLLCWGQPETVEAEPRIYRIGLVTVDAVAKEAEEQLRLQAELRALPLAERRAEEMVRGFGMDRREALIASSATNISSGCGRKTSGQSSMPSR